MHSISQPPHPLGQEFHAYLTCFPSRQQYSISTHFFLLSDSSAQCFFLRVNLFFNCIWILWDVYLDFTCSNLWRKKKKKVRYILWTKAVCSKLESAYEIVIYYLGLSLLSQENLEVFKGDLPFYRVRTYTKQRLILAQGTCNTYKKPKRSRGWERTHTC